MKSLLQEIALVVALGLVLPGAVAEARDDRGLELEVLPPGTRESARRLPEPGESPDGLRVEYTVDPELDARVRALLAQHEVALGHVILMDPRSGEVFSYVSTDPEAFPPTRAYPTASLMKVVTAAALLRKAPEAASRDCRYAGSPYVVKAAQLEPPPEGGRVESFARAMAISNNQCFARLAVHAVGERALLAEMRATGLLDAPAMRHSPGRVEGVDDALDLGELGSGLAGSFITPLGAARLAALLARGEVVAPWWIAQLRDAHGNLLGFPDREPPRRVWSASVTQRLRDVLVDVTETGTARHAFRDEDGRLLLDPVRVAGKTGTLHGDDPQGRYQWFIGVAPAEAPRLAIAAVVVNDAHPQGSAAHVAAATLRAVFCSERACDAARVERLLERSRRRDAAALAELEALESAEEQARRMAVVELDEPLRALGSPRLELPRHLLRKRAEGEIVLLLDLSEQGRVLDVSVDSSDLPRFDEVVMRQVESWRFSAPLVAGEPVRARARLPIPIRVR